LITFDPAKRAKTLAKRGLDFQRADQIFAASISRELTIGAITVSRGS
jgi:uncharacterized DUF497 family protein